MGRPKVKRTLTRMKTGEREMFQECALKASRYSANDPSRND